MKIPYNRLLVQGQILFAARGGKIHSFNLVDGSHISTWKHPDIEKAADASKATSEVETDKAPETEQTEPAAKRQKVEEGSEKPDQVMGDGAGSTEAGQAESSEPQKSDGNSRRRKKGRWRQGDQPERGFNIQLPSRPDRPLISQVISSPGGRHVVAVSGHDKVVWVFEHDGKGHLSEPTRRIMPKRPSAIFVGPDSQIVCADKFGDVYSLSLVMVAFLPSDAPQFSAKPAFKPAANALTVHSKRNLDALKNQTRHMELSTQVKAEADRAAQPSFNLTLQLGHVSMLTALLLGESDGRRYILSSDRDEHIRVSRYIPQAHVIEAFCLGHKDFVGDMTIPQGKEEILVSGGGDEDLFVWNWKTGGLLSKTNVLRLVHEISPETTKVAVSGLYSLFYPSEEGNLSYVVAICEDVKAIFSWQVTDDNTLHCPSIIQLPGKPLHLTISASDDGPPTIIAAMDPGETEQTKSLHRFLLTMNDGRLAVGAESTVEDKALEADELDVTEDEMRGLFYTFENLRKQPVSEGDKAAEDSQEVGTGTGTDADADAPEE